MSTQTQETQLNPGDVFKIQNTTPQACRVTLTTGGGTLVRVLLAPGAEIELVASAEPMKIDMEPLHDEQGRLHAIP